MAGLLLFSLVAAALLSARERNREHEERRAESAARDEEALAWAPQDADDRPICMGTAPGHSHRDD